MSDAMNFDHPVDHPVTLPSIARPLEKWNCFAPKMAVNAELAVECPHDRPMVHFLKFRRGPGLVERFPGP